MSPDLISELDTAANQSNSQDGSFFTLFVNAENLSMSSPPYVFGPSCFLDEKRKYCIYYFFSTMLVIIQTEVLVLILHDTLSHLQVPSNSAESSMHEEYPKLAAQGSTEVGLILSDFSYLIVSCLISPVLLFPSYWAKRDGSIGSKTARAGSLRQLSWTALWTCSCCLLITCEPKWWDTKSWDC